MKNNINPALQALKQFIGTWEMEISNASFFATLKPGGILVSYAISYALNMSSFVVMLFLALIANLLWLNYWPNVKKAVFYNIWTGKGTENSEPRYGKMSLKLSDC